VKPRITQLLQQLRAGDRSALDDLIDLIYPELHRIAKGHMSKERPDHTLQPTALVHEVYLKFFRDPPSQLADRAHFLALASQVMRRVLVDHARAHSAERRGGGVSNVPASSIEVAMDGVAHPLDLLGLNLAVEALTLESPELAQVVEMHYFGGMTAEEIAAAANRSVHVVRHELRLARAWLRREMTPRQA
jgi:RNA polymerase sigma-70 factor, ECF subfamily